MFHRKVVVTGASLLSGFGGYGATCQAVLAGKSAAAPGEPQWAQLRNPVHLTARIPAEFRGSALPPQLKKQAKVALTSTHWGIRVALDALSRAGLDLKPARPERIGIAVGNGPASSPPDPADSPSIFLLKRHPALPVGLLAQVLGVRGEVITDISTCTAGLCAIGRAADTIALGRAEIMCCVAVDHALNDTFVGHFASLGNVSPAEDPALACRPFNTQRSGLLLGEGAACVILEDEGHARKRGAKILAEVQGWSTRVDGNELTAPGKNGAGLAAALTSALDMAGVTPAELGYVNAHGTGTELNDPAEIAAFRSALGAHAAQTRVSSTMGATGHTMAAAGAIGAVFTILALANQTVPPTCNLREIDPECAGVHHLQQAEQVELRHAAKVALGFFGINAAVVFGKAT